VTHRKKRTAKHKAGQAPGSLIYVGKPLTEEVVVTVMDYSKEHYNENTLTSIEEAARFKHNQSVTWINVDGIHDIDTVRKLGEIFEIHPLSLEDILNPHHRPKFDDYDNYLFVILKMAYSENNGSIRYEHVCIILTDGVVISFQEAGEDVFKDIRERLRSGRGKIRKMPSDYLIYSLMDAIVDYYYVVLEGIEEIVSDLDQTVLEVQSRSSLIKEIHHQKREIRLLKQSAFPLREVVYALYKTESNWIKPETRLFFKDLYDHSVHATEAIDNTREVLSSMVEIYVSNQSIRLNETMKVLTVIATLFTPPTFIAAVYGMNFKVMPELSWDFGYLIVWLIFLATFLITFIYLKRKNWL
jgi:magnesium transporter